MAVTGYWTGAVLAALIMAAAVFAGCIDQQSAAREYVCPSGAVVDAPAKCGLPGVPANKTPVGAGENASKAGGAMPQDLVTIDYIISYENGTVFDTSVVGVAQKTGVYDPSKSYAPVSFIVGEGDVMPGVHDAVMGMSVGEEKGVTLTPDEGFGARNASLIQVVPRTHRSPLAQNISRSLFAEDIGEPVAGGEYMVPGKPGYRLDWPIRVDYVDDETVYFTFLPSGVGAIETVFGAAEVRAAGDEMVVTLNATAGSSVLTAAGPALVSGVDDENITVDFNSPLAGKTVRFWIKLLDLRTSEPFGGGEGAGTLEAMDRGYMRYVSSDYNVSLVYPSAWQVSEGFMGSAAAFFTESDTEADEFTDYLMLTVEDTSPYILTLDDYLNISVEQVMRVIPDANITGSGRTTLAGAEAQAIVFTGTQGEYRLKWLAVYTIRGERVYSLTYTAEEDSFEDYYRDMKDAIDSFEIRE